MKGQLFSILLFLVLVAGWVGPVYGEELPEEEDQRFPLMIEGTTVYPEETDAIMKVNDQWVFEDYPLLVDGYLMIPLRHFGEKFNMAVDWHPESKTAYLAAGDFPLLALQEDNPEAQTGKRGYDAGLKAEVFLPADTLPMDIAPKIINGRLYVQGRFVAEYFGYTVDYDETVFVFDEATKAQYSGLEKDSLPVVSFYRGGEINWIFETETQALKKNTVVKPYDQLTYDADMPFIYNNFPEMIGGNIFYETYINQQEVVGEGRVFISHANCSGQALDYIIRLENQGAEDTLVRLLSDFFVQIDEFTHDAEGVQHGQDFYEKKYRKDDETVTIGAGEHYDIVLSGIGDRKFFSGKLDFVFYTPMKVTSFAVPTHREDGKDHAEIATPDQPYDYGYEPVGYVPNAKSMEELSRRYSVYSGLGDSYERRISGAIVASELAASNMNCAFETGSFLPADLAEAVEIVLVEPRGENGEITKTLLMGQIPYVQDPEGAYDPNFLRNYGNMGNWGVDYYMDTELVNDTEEDQLFTLRLMTNKHAIYTVQSIDGITGTAFNNNKNYSSSYSRSRKGNDVVIKVDPQVGTWKVLEIAVPAGESRQVPYLYHLGTDSSSAVFHIWSMEPAPAPTE